MSRGTGFWTLMGVLVAACGCAGLPVFEQPDLGGRRARRESEAIRQFEAQRDRAQWLAARRAWEQGNAQACEESLSGLLARRPDHRDAALLWIELQILQDHLDLAEETLARLQTEAPDDPAVKEATELVASAREASETEGPQWALDELSNDSPGEALVSDEPSLPAPPVPDDSPPPRRARERSSAIQLTEGRVPTGLAQPSTADREETWDDAPAPGEAPTPRTLEKRRSAKDDSAPAAPVASSEAGERAAAELARATEELAAGDEEAARTRAEALVRDFPNEASVATAAGAWALKQERPDWALAWLEPRRKQFYRSAGVQRVLGLAYLRSDRAAEAESCLRRALRLDTSSALTYFLLGSCLERLGRTEAAERHFHQAARLDPRYSVRR